MKAIGYMRSAVKDNESIKQQKKEIQAHCEAKGWSLAALYKDNGFSGLKLDRPGLDTALANLDPDTFLVVTDIHRLSRKSKDLVLVMATIANKGAGFVCIHKRLLDLNVLLSW